MPDEPISSQHITLTASDGHTFDAYVASTKKIPEAAVVVIQEIFGVNRHIRAVVDDFASEGFLAIAPAIFDRAERGIQLDYTPETMQRGMKIAQSIGMDAPLKDIAAAMEYAGREVAPTAVGVVGYCWGGSLAWLSATRMNPIAAVCYYGGQIARFAEETPQCPVMLHYGERDKHITPADIEAVRSRHPEVAVYTYDADHGFNCTDRSSYNQEAATMARSRTLEFLRAKLLTH